MYVVIFNELLDFANNMDKNLVLTHIILQQRSPSFCSTQQTNGSTHIK